MHKEITTLKDKSPIRLVVKAEEESKFEPTVIMNILQVFTKDDAERVLKEKDADLILFDRSLDKLMDIEKVAVSNARWKVPSSNDKNEVEGCWAAQEALGGVPLLYHGSKSVLSEIFVKPFLRKVLMQS